MGILNLFLIQFFLFFLLFLYYFDKPNSLFNPYRKSFHPDSKKMSLSESIILFENNYEILKKVKENKIDKEYCICIVAKHRDIPQLFKPRPAYLSSVLGSMTKYFTKEDWEKVNLKIITQTIERHAEHDYLNPFFDIEKRKEEKMKHSKFTKRDDEILDYLTCLEYCNSFKNVKYSLILKDHAQLTRRIFPNLENEMKKLKDNSWIWIKLYFSDQFRGWSSSDILPLIFISLLLSLLLSFFYITFFFLYTKVVFSNSFKIFIFISFFLFSILVLIMIGKQNLLMDKKGIHKLDENGFAISQIYPQWILKILIQKLHNRYTLNHPDFSGGDYKSLEGVLGEIGDELKLDKLIYFPYFYKDIGLIKSYE